MNNELATHRMIDKIIENTYVRLTSLAAVVIACISITWAAAGLYRNLEATHDEINARIEQVGAQTVLIQAQLELMAIRLTEGGWSRYDHDIWCRETELLNVETGWVCGETHFGDRHTEGGPK